MTAIESPRSFFHVCLEFFFILLVCRKTKQKWKTLLYSDGTTHIEQHRSKGVQRNGSPCANNHCSTRYEQSFWYNKHTHTNKKAATDQDSRHNHYINRKLHQGTQSLHNIYKSQILTKSIQNWRSTRWRPFTNTIQHLHCRHTTTKSTSSGHGLSRWHYHHIYTHKHECRQEIHTTIPTYSICVDKTKQSHTQSRQINLHTVHSRPCRICEQSRPPNKQHCTTHEFIDYLLLYILG